MWTPGGWRRGNDENAKNLRIARERAAIREVLREPDPHPAARILAVAGIAVLSGCSRHAPSEAAAFQSVFGVATPNAA